MITVYNADNIAQQIYFKKAYAELKAKQVSVEDGGLTPKEQNQSTFYNLEQYFAHMAALVKINPVYAMLPSDEQPFVINANARTITVPADFNRCAAVVGDNMCEIITFVIDRYFDYYDLAEAKIAVQWSTAEHDGVSMVGLRDLITESGKMRFGWPITGKLTEVAGPVTFSVRFFVQQDVEQHDGSVKKDQIVYILNTLPATINIKPSLNITNPSVEEEKDDIIEMFGLIAQNNNNPAYEIPEPIYFVSPGQNLPAQEKLKNNVVTLEAQAIAAGNGEISYNWYFSAGATPDNKLERIVKAEEYDPEQTYYAYVPETGAYKEVIVATEEIFNKGTYYIIEKLQGELIPYGGNSDPDEGEVTTYTVADVYKLVYTADEPKKRNGNDKYFTKDENGEPQLLVGDISNVDEDVYERYTTLTINSTDEKNITGLYWVEAINSTGKDTISIEGVDGEVIEIDAINKTNPEKSKACYLPLPQTLVFEKELPENVFLDEETLDLVVEVNKDSGNPTRAFSWTKTNIKGEETELTGEDLDEKGNSNKLVVSEPGWYNVNVKSELNRSESSLDAFKEPSKGCRVVKSPVAPVITRMEYQIYSGKIYNPDDDEVISGPLYDGEVFTEMDKTLAESEDRVRLEVMVDTESFDDLTSDSITYKWFIIIPDEEARELTLDDYLEKDGNESILYDKSGEEDAGINKPVIHVNVIKNDVEVPYQFYCEVTNTLVDRTAVFGRDKYERMFQIW